MTPTPTPITDATAAAATGNYVRDMLTMSGVARRFEERAAEAETELGETMLVLGKALYPDADLVAGDVLELAKAVVEKLASAHADGARLADRCREITYDWERPEGQRYSATMWCSNPGMIVCGAWCANEYEAALSAAEEVKKHGDL